MPRRSHWCRSLEESVAVARAVNQSKHLRLVGVAGYEV